MSSASRGLSDGVPDFRGSPLASTSLLDFEDFSGKLRSGHMPIPGNAFENSSPEHFPRTLDFFKVSEGDDLANASLESSSQQVRIGQTCVHGTQFEEHIIEHGPCEAGPSIFGNFSILHCNIRGFLSHRAELEGHLRLLPEAPALICINETFLDDSVDDGVVSLGGYKFVADTRT